MRRMSILGLLCATGLLATTWNAEAALRVPDFNGDGRADLAISDSPLTSGRVYILLGDTSVSGFRTSGFFIDQDTAGVPDTAESTDFFGGALAWGNFNGDGFTDLVVSAAGEDVNGVTGAGAFHVFYGGPNGPQPGSAFFVRGQNGVVGTPAKDAFFGRTLTTGDFNGDGVDDLAVGVGNVGAGGVSKGEVHIFYGTGGSAGLVTTFNHVLLPSHFGITSTNVSLQALAAGDLDCDGDEDLAIGFANALVSNQSNAGKVLVAYAGINAFGFWSRFETWDEARGTIQGTPAADDSFGHELAIGNFDGDTSAGRACNDLVVGAPLKKIGGVEQAGAFHVIRGSSAGLTDVGNQFFSHDMQGFGGPLLRGRFGSSFAVTLLNDTDQRDDLIIGVPGAAIGGGVQLMKGGTGGIIMQDAVLWTKATPGINLPATTSDAFGLEVGGNLRQPVFGSVGTPMGAASIVGIAVLPRMKASSKIELLSSRVISSATFNVTPVQSQRFSWAITKPRPSR